MMIALGLATGNAGYAWRQRAAAAKFGGGVTAADGQRDADGQRELAERRYRRAAAT